VKITLEGTPKEMRQFLVAPTIPSGTGTSLDIDTVLTELSQVTPNARAALKFICEHAPRVGFDPVAYHVGVTTKVLSGNMSSIWNSAPTIGAVLDRDYDKRLYLIDPEDAKVILAGFEALG
jgi:hypothetical protein